jgi:alpha-methylacyl-CoA racemase
MGPLSGVRVIELAGIGPAPYGAMLLADLGAEIVRVERASATPGEPSPTDSLLRNRRTIALNSKNPQAVEIVLRLVEKADVLIEGFRPGVTERLGLGPDTCLARNPRLVYGRMTGWGQQGPLAKVAGHDINYISLTGALHQIGPQGGKPVPPLNLVGDMGGGGMLLAFGLLAALIEARQSGTGQVVDAAMIDGAISMMGVFFAARAASPDRWRDETGNNTLTGAAPWYDTYRTKDGRYVAVGAIEPQFYALLLEKIGLDPKRWAPLGFPAQDEATRRAWPELRAAMAAAFASRTRDEWCSLLEGTDACYSPVLSMDEAVRHPHNVAREAFITVDGLVQNAPAPRFSRTPAAPVRGPRPAGADTEAVLREAGYSSDEIAQLRSAGALT